MMNPGFEEEFPSYGDFAEYAGGALSYARKKMKMPPYLPETAPFHMYATVYIPMHGPLQELKFASIASMGIRTSLDLSGIRQSDKVERFMEDVKKECIFSWQNEYTRNSKRGLAELCGRGMRKPPIQIRME